MNQEADLLLCQLVRRVNRYYEGLERENFLLLHTSACNAWNLLRSENKLALNKSLFCYGAFAVTAEYPTITVDNIVSAGLTNFGPDTLFEVLPNYFSVDYHVRVQATVFQFLLFERIASDLKDHFKHNTDEILSKILKTQFAALIFMLQALPKHKVRENYFIYTRRVMYFALSYIIDDIIDSDDVHGDTQQLDALLEAGISGSSLVAFKHLSSVETVVCKYVKDFSEEIVGMPNEHALRVHLLAFHRAQRQAKRSDNVLTFSTCKSAFCLFVIPFLFGENRGFEHWDRLLPFAAFSQLNDDVDDFLEDVNHAELTPIAAYVEKRNGSDPLVLWCKVFCDLLRGQSEDMQTCIFVRTIQKLSNAPIDVIRMRYPHSFAKPVEEMLELTTRDQSTWIFSWHLPVFFVFAVLSCLYWNARVLLLVCAIFAAAFIAYLICRRPCQVFVEKTQTRRLQATVQQLLNNFSYHRHDMTKSLRDVYLGRGRLEDNMAYALDGGTCGRSYIVKLVGEHYGFDASKLQPLMQAVEVAQTASLVFDDLPWQDNGEVRRSKPCLHKTRPPFEAELTGISLTTEPFRLLAEWRWEPSLKLKIIHLAATNMGPSGLCLGQLIDLEDSAIALADFVKLYDLKTSKGFRIPFISAAIACGACEEDIQRLEELAHKLGVAYQIRDDLLERSTWDPQASGPSQKVSGRLAARMTDSDVAAARELFLRYRNDVVDIVFQFFHGLVLFRMTQLVLKLLVLPGETNIYTKATSDGKDGPRRV